MSEHVSGFHTRGRVEEYFMLESHVLSTRSADAYNAIDRSRNVGVTLWQLRHPLAIDSEAVKRFLTRMNAIDQVEPRVCEMTGYGVDNLGVAFTVFPPLDGSLVAVPGLETAEAERRFLACVSTIARLHAAGIVCGDLCASSFWMSRLGDLQFVGVMGSFDSEATATAMLPPVETLHFMAPEQKAGGGLQIASDTYSLGVLGYLLFTGVHPFGENPLMPSTGELAKPPSSMIADAPIWLDHVLGKALALDPSLRYQSAGELLADVSRIRQEAHDRSQVPVRRSGTKGATGSSGDSQSLHVHTRQVSTPSEEPLSRIERRLVIIPVALVTMLVVAGLFYFLMRANPKRDSVTKLQSGLAPHASVTGKDLRVAIDAIADPNLPIYDKKRALSQIANSDDPLAADVLFTSARDADTAEFRKLSEEAIIRRARRLGMMRSAEEVKRWLDTESTGTQLPT
ncbi:MAG: hypothetical protein KDD53_03595, partial [Bdellovibrionales bacterium]|nr:hypothetical protein [Bdellovibrionales bacterium]